MKNARVKFILLWIFLIVSFSILAVFLLLEAYGYRVDRQNWRIEQTATIVLNGTPRQVNISVNRNLPPDQILPATISKLLPGEYEIIIAKEGYQTWTHSVRLAGGQAVEFDKITLFLTEPKIAESERKLSLADVQQDYTSQSNNLDIRENEIYYQDKLVTRTSSKILGAILTPDRYHIIYQEKAELRVMDLDGTNNIKLITLPNDSKISFALYNNKNLVWASESKIWEAEIR